MDDAKLGGRTGETPDAALEPVQLMTFNMPEACALWNEITGDELTLDDYREMCASGWLSARGVNVIGTAQGGHLTDVDSLLAFLERDIREQYLRAKAMLEERRAELEGF